MVKLVEMDANVPLFAQVKVNAHSVKHRRRNSVNHG